MIFKQDCYAWALCLVRLLMGATFIAHGCQKVFGWFGGPGIHGFAGWIAGLGMPLWLGYAAGGFELIAGILLFFGIAAEFGALMVVPVMVMAIYLIHSSHGYFLPQGCEYALNLAVLALVVIIGGPGKLALWDVFNCCRQ